MGLFDGVREYLALKKFQKTPLAKALRQHTQKYFYGEGVLSDFSEQTKQKLIEGFLAQLSEAMSAPNPAMKLRENIINYVFQYTQVQVLALTEDEKSEMWFFDNPHISGQLYRHIELACEQVNEVAEYKWETSASANDLIQFCNGRAVIYSYYLNGANLVRMDIGDKTDPDWFRPFVESQLIWNENVIRNGSKLPLTVDGLVDNLEYSVFCNLVENGERNPFYEFCKSYPEKYLTGKPGDRAA